MLNFAGSATGGNDIFSTSESLLDVGSVGEVYAFESALIEFLSHAFESGGIGVVKTNVGGEAHH